MRYLHVIGLSCLLSLWSPLGFAQEEESPEISVSETVEIVGETIDLFGGKVAAERIEEIQPIDIADLLKKDVEGVGFIRKSGIAMDPVFRGLSKERFNVLMDGGTINGACPNRMDPPTFHITPYQIQAVEITKGPYDVTLGPGNLGGIVNVEMKLPDYFPSPELRSEIRTGIDSVAGAFKGAAHLQGGNAPWGFHLAYDYKSSDGYYAQNAENDITAGYQQQNFTTGMSYYLNSVDRIGIQYTGQRSRDVYYPTLTMDSPRDDMDLVSVTFHQENPESFLKATDARVYSSWVDHLMNNDAKFQYADTKPGMRMQTPAESMTYGGKIKFSLDLLDGTHAGFDYNDRRWDAVTTIQMMNGMRTTIHAIPDTVVRNFGIFLQPQKDVGEVKVTAGLRIDFVNAEARGVGQTEAAYFDYYYAPGTSAQLDDSGANFGAFLKGELPVSDGTNIYAAAGRGTRSPDAKERFRILAPVPGGRYEIGNPGLKSEDSFQFEIGTAGAIGRIHYNVSAFHNSVNNFVVQTATGKTFMQMPVMGFLNRDAVFYGGELAVGAVLSDRFSLAGSTSYTWAENTTEHKPLPEILPWEGRITLRYSGRNSKYWLECGGRFVADQNRYDPKVDPGATPGFATLDLRFGMRIIESVQLVAGLENALDRYYFEHTSRTFAFNQDGFTTKDRLPEPGRNAYVSVSVGF